MVLDLHTRLQSPNKTEPRNLFGLPLQYLGHRNQCSGSYHGYEVIFIKFIGRQQSFGPALGSDSESQTLQVNAL